MVSQGDDASHDGRIPGELIIVSDRELGAATLDEIKAAVDLSGPITRRVDGRGESRERTRVIDDAAAADGAVTRQKVAEHLGVAVKLEGASSRDDEGVVVVSRGRGVHRRRGEAVENRVVRGGRGEFQGSQADRRGAGVIASRTGVEEQFAVAGLGQAAGGGRDDTAEGGVGGQRVARTHHMHEEGAGVGAGVAGVDRSDAKPGTGDADRIAGLGEDTTAIQAEVAEIIDREAAARLEGERVDRGRREDGGEGARVDARVDDAGVSACGDHRVRDRYAHLGGGVERTDAIGGVVGHELRRAGGPDAADKHVRHGPRHDAHGIAARGRRTDEGGPVGTGGGRKHHVGVRGRGSLAQRVASDEQGRLAGRCERASTGRGDAQVGPVVIQRDDVMSAVDRQLLIRTQRLVDARRGVAEQFQMTSVESNRAGRQSGAAGGYRIVEAQAAVRHDASHGGTVEGDRAAVSDRSGGAADGERALVDRGGAVGIGGGQDDRVGADLGEGTGVGVRTGDHSAQRDVAGGGDAGEGVDPVRTHGRIVCQRDGPRPGGGCVARVDDGALGTDGADSGDRAGATEAGAGDGQGLRADAETVEIKDGARSDGGAGGGVAERRGMTESKHA